MADSIRVSTRLILIQLLALGGPLILYPIELVWPAPHIIEELFKAGAARYIASLETKKHTYIWAVIGFGLLFTLSETGFYLINIWAVGQFGHVPLRLAYTGTLHLGTTLLMYLGFKTKYRYWGPICVLLAIIFHYFYNLWI